MTLQEMWAQGRHGVCYGGQHARHVYGAVTGTTVLEVRCDCGEKIIRREPCPTCGHERIVER
jgi:hypothetical protein